MGIFQQQPHFVLILLCAVLLIGTALLHSILGERRLIGPLLRHRDGILNSPLARFLIRVVWHFMTLLFFIIAAALLAGLHSAQASFSVLLFGTALGIGGAGLVDALGSCGRHVGWPLLVLIGLTAGLALVFLP